MLEESGKIEKDNELVKNLRQVIEEDIADLKAAPADHPERIKMANFFNWLKAGGCTFQGFKVRWFSETNRGMVASKDIKIGDFLFTVPRTMQVTQDYCQNTERGKILQKHEARLAEVVQDSF